MELKDNLECELEALVGRMEAKANQITKVRKYQAQVTPSPHLLVMINFLPWSLLRYVYLSRLFLRNNQFVLQGLIKKNSHLDFI